MGEQVLIELSEALPIDLLHTLFRGGHALAAATLVNVFSEGSLAIGVISGFLQVLRRPERQVADSPSVLGSPVARRSPLVVMSICALSHSSRAHYIFILGCLGRNQVQPYCLVVGLSMCWSPVSWD